MSEQQKQDRQEPEYVSISNLQEDTEELLHFNPEADANAALPPVPAGTYPFVARFTEEDPEKRVTQAIWGKDLQKTYVSSITLTLYATEGGAFDGRTVRHQVSTYTMERSGTNSMQGLLQGLGYGEQLKTCRTRSALVLLLNDVLGTGDGAAGDGAVIDWEAAEQLDEEERAALKAKGKKQWRLQGMRNFPKDTKTGAPVPEVMHDGQVCRAYNVVQRFITKTEPGAGASNTVANEAPQPVAAARPAVRQVATPVTGPVAPSSPPVPAGARRAVSTGAPVPAGRK